MALNPIDYSTQSQDPYASTLHGLNSGFKLGLGIRQQKIEEQQLKLKQEQEQFKRNTLLNLANNPTPENYIKTTNMFPDLAENLKKSYDMMDDASKKASVNTSSQVSLMLSNNDNEGAKAILDDRIKAFERSGDMNQANAYKAFKVMIDSNPEQAKLGTMLIASQGLTPDQLPDFFSKFGKESREQELQPYEIKQKEAQTGLTTAQTAKTTAEGEQAQYEANNTPTRITLENNQTQANIDKIYADIDNNSQRLGLDKDRLTSEVELKLSEIQQSGSKLSEGAQKIVNDSVIASSAASTSASSLIDLANRLDKAGGGYGGVSRMSEWLKNATGNQDAMTSLRQEYTRMRNSEAMKMLPPGPATDKDIELVMQGFPKNTADSKEVASFLRGMAKLNQRTAVMEEAKAEWANMNGNMGSNKRDIEVLGVRVPQGTTFNSFVSNNFNAIQKQQSNQRIRQQVASGQRSYMQE